MAPPGVGSPGRPDAACSVANTGQLRSLRSSLPTCRNAVGNNKYVEKTTPRPSAFIADSSQFASVDYVVQLGGADHPTSLGRVGTGHMTTTTSYFLRPRVLLIWAALAASVMAVVLASPASTAQTTVQAGTPLAWGCNAYGQSDIPSGLTDMVAVAAGGYHQGQCIKAVKPR